MERRLAATALAEEALPPPRGHTGVTYDMRMCLHEDPDGPHPERPERVVAAVELVLGAEPPNTDDLIAHVKGSLASYKAPRQIRIVESIGRTPAGKMDYGRHKAEMLAWLDAQS